MQKFHKCGRLLEREVPGETEIIRQGGADIQGRGLSGGREDEPGGMEKEPPEAQGFSELPVQGKVPVLVVPQDGVSQAGKMAADLVGAAGTQFQFQQGEAVPPSPEGVGGFRRPGTPLAGKGLPDGP
jgi:hypothetical protein